MIIDIHTHCFPSEMAPYAIAHLEGQSKQLQSHTGGTVKHLRTSSREAGIDLAVLQPVATKPSQVININQWALTCQGDGIMSFAALHPEMAQPKTMIKELVSLGCKGVKFHPDFQNFYVDDPKALHLYEQVFQAGLIILFHTGADACMPAPYHCTPEKLEKVVDSFPGGKIISAHLGGFLQWEQAFEHLVGKDLYLDTAFVLPFLTQDSLTKIIYAHGVDRVLFGTDSPWTCQKQGVEIMKSLGLKSDEYERIMGTNAVELLQLGGVKC